MTNPWEVFGWLLVGVAAAVVLIFIALLVYIIVFSVRDYKKEKVEEVLRNLPAPHFFGMKPGDEFTVNYQAWAIKQIETDFDIDRNRHNLRITAYTVGDN